MLNHRTCLRLRGNTQVQGRHGREAAPGTQGLLGIRVQTSVKSQVTASWSPARLKSLVLPYRR
jgi:hypothetical protein